MRTGNIEADCYNNELRWAEEWWDPRLGDEDEDEEEGEEDDGQQVDDEGASGQGRQAHTHW